MCNCGCNTCETKGPLLMEGKVKSLLSEGLQYHIDKKIPLFETVYRIGSDKHLALIKEARKMYSRNVIDLCEDDEALIKTHLGEFALYEGESVPLDLPMLEVSDKNFVKGIEVIKQTLSKEGGAAGLEPLVKELVKLGFKKDEVIDLLSKMTSVKKHRDGDYILLPLEESKDEQLDEKKKAKKKEKKDPPLNKPKRGGSKAYYVYVRDPKTKKIKKVSFGSGGLRAKIRNPKARKAFAARHNCKNKKDRTKAGYWSCNLPRYAPALGLGAKMNTFW